ECLDSHIECRQKTSTHTPSRLIDVRPKLSAEVRVVNTNTIKDPSWAALSYCWGGPQKRAQSTTKNIQVRQSQLPLGDLPRTLRDAIHVCRQLNIGFLWIDVICIIQDDEKDMQAELAKMAGVYQDAIITISASCASSSEIGFLEDRLTYSPHIALPARNEDGYDIVQLIDPESSTNREPIDTRAWTFQEHVLSTRTLSYTARAVKWDCPHLHCNIDHYGRYSKLEHFGVEDERYRRGWETIVGDYSERLLSNPGDRPVAIAAVAETHAVTNHIVANDYLAGLWRGSLLKELLWVPNCYGVVTVAEGLDWCLQKNRLEQHQIAPSWSWTSVLYRVMWPGTMRQHAGFVETAKLIDIQVELKYSNLPFGPVKRGRIRSRGALHPAKHLTDGGMEFPIVRDSRFQDMWELDVPSLEGLEGIDVWFFEVGMVPKTHTHECAEGWFDDVFGLVLFPTGKPNEFWRVGVYGDERNPRGYNETFDESCKWCRHNREGKETQVDIV
ncbi:hypothetical protein FDECE_17894, partial [Fusarium decemcellulare]